MDAERRCTATNRQGNPCGRAAIAGGSVCSRHGGGSPQAKAAAGRRLAIVAAREAVATFGLPIDVDPTEALLAEVQRTAGHVAWLGAKVSQLDPEDLVWGKASHTSGKMAVGVADYTEERAMVSIWYELYLSERKHLAAVATAAIRAGCEQRRVQLAEAQGQLLADVIRRVLDDDELGLDPARRAIADGVARRHLLALTAEPEGA
jgi:hypothetical protein